MPDTPALYPPPAPNDPMPGPWRLSDHAEGIAVWAFTPETDREIVCAILPSPRAEATAHRIAAAPRLLDACKSVEHWLSVLDEDIHDDASPVDQTVDALGERFAGPVHLDSLAEALATLRTAIAAARGTSEEVSNG